MQRKILIIVENLPVPRDIRVWNEARALRAAGYQVTVLCPRGKGFEAGYEYLEGIHIYRHPMPGEGNSALGHLAEYGCALFYEFVYSLWIYLRRGFHIIQGCNPPDTVFLVALPFRFRGVKYVFDHHDVCPELYVSKYERTGLFYRIQLWLEKATFRSSDVVISTNNTYRSMALGRGGKREQDVFVVRNGPDLRTFRLVPPNPARKHGKAFLVGYVGNIGSQEGLDILLDAALEMRKRGRHDVHFTCIGGGPGLPSLRKLAADKGLGDMVEFSGRISDEDLLEILSTADVCVNPDRPCAMNSMSTMIKIMEYMALGKPIVQFDGIEGRYSAQDASVYSRSDGDLGTDFADQIEWLLDRPEERARMGEAGRKRVEEHLAWEHSVPHLLDAYERAFAKTRLGRAALQADVAGS